MLINKDALVVGVVGIGDPSSSPAPSTLVGLEGEVKIKVKAANTIKAATLLVMG